MKPILLLILIFTSFYTLKAQEFKPYKYSFYSFKYDPALQVEEDKVNGILEFRDTLIIDAVEWIWQVRFFKGEKAKGRTFNDVMEEEKNAFRLAAEGCSNPVFKDTFRGKDAVLERYFCSETSFGQITTWTFIENGNIAKINISLRPEKEVDRYTSGFAEHMSEEYLFSRIKDLQLIK